MRISWEQYFLQITFTVAQRSTCLRRQVGAIAVRERRILATGYNGTPVGISHCLDKGCIREQLGIPSGERHEMCRGLHAEQNVIIQAAVHGISLKDSILYCTTQPCLICTKMLINCEVKEIYYVHSYNDSLAIEMLNEAKIKFEQIDLIPNNHELFT